MKKSTVEAFRILKRRAKNGDSEAVSCINVFLQLFKKHFFYSLNFYNLAKCSGRYLAPI